MITEDQSNTADLTPDFPDLENKLNDSVRIAYQWFDAQTKKEVPLGNSVDLQHLIRDWGGREISQNDIEIAASIHPGTKGEYPRYNIDSGMTLPSAERLRGIVESFKDGTNEQHVLGNYRFYEVVKYSLDNERSVTRSFYAEGLPESQYDSQDFCTQHDNCQCYYCVYGR